MTQSVFSRGVKVVGLASMLAFAAGCANNQQIEEANATAERALQVAQQAQQAAEAANRKADEASRKADAAQTCCNRNSEKIDRAFQRSQSK